MVVCDVVSGFPPGMKVTHRYRLGDAALTAQAKLMPGPAIVEILSASAGEVWLHYRGRNYYVFAEDFWEFYRPYADAENHYYLFL